MLKITRMKNGKRVLKLMLEGKLLEPWVPEVQQVLTEANGRSNRVCLDLAAVTFVDSAGVRLLRDLIHRGVTVERCSAFVAELLHNESNRGKL